MNLIRYNSPWNFFNQLQREFYSPRTRDYEDDNTTNWSPAVDVHESDNAYTLLVDVPGVAPKDIDVSMEKGTLTIKGERSNVSSSEHDGVKRVEKQYGVFSRCFNLPESADAENITADADNGVLTVTIPKQEVAVSRRIEVKH